MTSPSTPKTDDWPEINWTLIQELTAKPHKHLNIADDFAAQIASIPLAWVGEVFQEARTVQHLLDLAGVPEGKRGSTQIDARTYQFVIAASDRAIQLSRIASWHSRESGPGGMVGDFCNECGRTWPCDTRRMVDGTYVDDETILDEEA